jgi:hypothetical protein
MSFADSKEFVFQVIKEYYEDSNLKHEEILKFIPLLLNTTGEKDKYMSESELALGVQEVEKRFQDLIAKEVLFTTAIEGFKNLPIDTLMQFILSQALENDLSNAMINRILSHLGFKVELEKHWKIKMQIMTFLRDHEDIKKSALFDAFKTIPNEAFQEGLFDLIQNMKVTKSSALEYSLFDSSMKYLPSYTLKHSIETPEEKEIRVKKQEKEAFEKELEPYLNLSEPELIALEMKERKDKTSKKHQVILEVFKRKSLKPQIEHESYSDLSKKLSEIEFMIHLSQQDKNNLTHFLNKNNIVIQFTSKENLIEAITSFLYKREAHYISENSGSAFLDISTLMDDLTGYKWAYLRNDFSFQKKIGEADSKHFLINNNDLFIHSEIKAGEKFPTTRYWIISLVDQQSYPSVYNSKKEIYPILKYNLIEFIEKKHKLPFGCSFEPSSDLSKFKIVYRPDAQNRSLDFTMNFDLDEEEFPLTIDQLKNYAIVKENPLDFSPVVLHNIKKMTMRELGKIYEVGFTNGHINVFNAKILMIDTRIALSKDPSGNTHESTYYILLLSDGEYAIDDKKRTPHTQMDTNLVAKASDNAMFNLQFKIGDRITFRGAFKDDLNDGFIVQNIRSFEKIQSASDIEPIEPKQMLEVPKSDETIAQKLAKTEKQWEGEEQLKKEAIQQKTLIQNYPIVFKNASGYSIEFTKGLYVGWDSRIGWAAIIKDKTPTQNREEGIGIFASEHEALMIVEGIKKNSTNIQDQMDKVASNLFKAEQRFDDLIHKAVKMHDEGKTNLMEYQDIENELRILISDLNQDPKLIEKYIDTPKERLTIKLPTSIYYGKAKFRDIIHYPQIIRNGSGYSVELSKDVFISSPISSTTDNKALAAAFDSKAKAEQVMKDLTSNAKNVPLVENIVDLNPKICGGTTIYQDAIVTKMETTKNFMGSTIDLTLETMTGIKYINFYQFDENNVAISLFENETRKTEDPNALCLIKAKDIGIGMEIWRKAYNITYSFNNEIKTTTTNTQPQQNDQQIAQDILALLGGMRGLSMMIGAKNFAISREGDVISVQFHFPNKPANMPNAVIIKKLAENQFQIEFYRIRAGIGSILATLMVSAEDLPVVFQTQTGLSLYSGIARIPTGTYRPRRRRSRSEFGTAENPD